MAARKKDIIQIFNFILFYIQLSLNHYNIAFSPRGLKLFYLTVVPGFRYLLNDACVILNKPLVSGSALRWEGQLTVYNLNGGPTYRCLYPEPPPPSAVTNCSDGGVLGVVPGVIGVMQVWCYALVDITDFSKNNFPYFVKNSSNAIIHLDEKSIFSKYSIFIAQSAR